jgi:DNA mismatch repair protein MutS
MVITGPNAGGKSTALQTATTAVNFAQCFGIAPAKSMVMTPFAKIITYLNIADHIGKLSLFQAEMARTGEFLKMIKGMKPNEFCFVIMDEMFTGTNPDQGSEGSYKVAQYIATYPNVMCLFATHFYKMTELEKATNTIIKNYKVEVVIHEDKKQKIEYTYKLAPGISNQKIAMLMLEQDSNFNEVFAADKQKQIQEESPVAAAAV